MPEIWYDSRLGGPDETIVRVDWHCGGVFRCAGIGAAGAERAIPADAAPQYSIDAILYGTVRDFPVAGLVVGAPKDEKIDIAMVFWLIRGGGRTILFDSGFHRLSWIDRFHVVDFISPNDELRTRWEWILPA